MDDPNYRPSEWSPEELRVMRTEVSRFFLDGMVKRMLVSFYKYGPVADGFPDKIDALASARQRIALYKKTGNTEALMDAANFLMIEFMHPSLDEAHFEGTDDSGSPGRMDRTTRAATKRANADIAT